MNNLAPKPATPERTLSVPVDRGQDHRRIRPGMVDVARVAGAADEHFAVSLKTLSMRTLAHKMGVHRDSVLVDQGKEVRLEISEHATIELTREQTLRLVADLARSLGLKDGTLQGAAATPRTLEVPLPPVAPDAASATRAPVPQPVQSAAPARPFGRAPAAPAPAASDPPVSDPPVSDPPVSDPPVSDRAVSDPAVSDRGPPAAQALPRKATAPGGRAEMATDAAPEAPRRFGKRSADPGARPAIAPPPEPIEPLLPERPRRRTGRAALLGLIAVPVAVIPLASAWVVASFLMGRDFESGGGPVAARPVPATSDGAATLAAVEAPETQRGSASGAGTTAEALPRALFEAPRSTLPRIAWAPPATRDASTGDATSVAGEASGPPAAAPEVPAGGLPSAALLAGAARAESVATRPADGAEDSAAARAVTLAAAAIATSPATQAVVRTDAPPERPAPIAVAPPPERPLGASRDAERLPDILPIVAAAPALAPALAPAAPATPARGPSTGVVVRARADTWLQVRDGRGEVLISRVLRAGEEWSAPRVPGLRLTTGNAGGTEVEVNGTVLPPLGPVGVVRRDMLLNGQ